MSSSTYFMWICISSWELIGGSVWTLPHVMEYQTVIPQRLKDSSHSTDAAPQTYPDVLRYSLTIAGQNLTLHLERNRDLVAKNFSVTYYSDQGIPVTTAPDLEGHCYYHGHVVGMDESSASMGLCSGLKGFVRLTHQLYLIEPLSGAEAGRRAGRQSHKTHIDEGLHAVYNYKHLKRKRSSCSHGNTTTFYDHGARPSGLFQFGSLKSRAQTKSHTRKPRTVELVVVVDHTEYKKFGSRKKMETRVLEVANHVDKLYRPVGVRVMLVGVDIWSAADQIEISTNPEQTLVRFLEWRQQSLLQRTRHDNAQLITGVDFDGSTVGLANTNAMCTSNSGAVNEDHNANPIGVASTIAHEMGHNLGLSHDVENCICGSLSSSKGCIMADSVGLIYPVLFSSCSQQQLTRFLDEVDPACLLDNPSTDRIYGGPVCGNAFLEPGEQCDCGTAEECKNPCCNATTCKFVTGAQCAEGECCHNCQLKPTGSICRPTTSECDLAEFCTGLSAFCPADAYAQNGWSCNRGEGYCYNGQCPSHQKHCKRLWGPDAEVAADDCFYKDRICRKTFFGQRCSGQGQSCGTLYCSGGWEFPVTSKKSFITLTNGVICNEATMNPEDNYPADLGMVPTGTKCGNNMVCYNQRCQEIKNIKVYGAMDCSAKCNNHGVCNHERECHCDPSWAPPYCDVHQTELPKGIDLVLNVSKAMGALLILVLVIGSLIYLLRRKHLPAKRCLQSTSGQSNPLFRSGSTQGGPQPVHISQPTFVESSATQVCKALSFATARSSPGVIKPSRAAPEPPKKMPVVPQPSKIEQVVRPLMQPTFVPSKPAVFESKPLPPSRPLPPLGAKPLMKPKPPVPPTKPKSSAVPSLLHHTQLVAGRTAMMPLNRPR
ncbi:disintegrin and metalloproteinase domain-containing protein 8a [Thalassophryne amazonica]|uniref:disintegrin and metalloproteinase domain-containing protein 8a n=1 Tax=Thalassophryne amazonica TaxID=390379 RepID=UPI0014721C05|nr:disintegrin and metalloproteinase domain-containing protein 8a [Thalassophryne amazonica]